MNPVAEPKKPKLKAPRLPKVVPPEGKPRNLGTITVKITLTTVYKINSADYAGMTFEQAVESFKSCDPTIHVECALGDDDTEVETEVTGEKAILKGETCLECKRTVPIGPLLPKLHHPSCSLKRPGRRQVFCPRCTESVTAIDGVIQAHPTVVQGTAYTCDGTDMVVTSRER